MKIAITGAKGLVGSALTTALNARHDVHAAGRGDLDIRDAESVARFISGLAPDLVINCAVIGVDACEEDPAIARAINVEGPWNLAKAAAATGARLFHFSTNYVFAGDRTDGGFYDSVDPAVPINIYGETKREGEQITLNACERALVIRTSWVFGVAKPTLLSTLPRRLRNRERVSTISDLFASCTFVDDLVKRVLELISLEATGVVHANNAGVCSQTTFAEQVAHLVGVPGDLISREELADSTRRAQRPRWTPMRCSRSESYGLAPMRSWEEALADYCGSLT